MKTETFIVLVPTGSGVDREDLDNTSMHIWNSKDQFLNDLNCSVEHVRFIPIYEFADWWNDNDSDIGKEESIGTISQSTWMGYCIIKKD